MLLILLYYCPNPNPNLAQKLISSNFTILETKAILMENKSFVKLQVEKVIIVKL